VGTIHAENERTLIVAKLESRRGVTAAAEIVAVDGIDAVLVTSGDLSVDLGVPGEGDHPLVRDAMEQVLQICLTHGKAAACAVSIRRLVGNVYTTDTGSSSILGTLVYLVTLSNRDSINRGHETEGADHD
jgi:4-hydroxy-2-oxoheptanedioate aldolase